MHFREIQAPVRLLRELIFWQQKGEVQRDFISLHFLLLYVSLTCYFIKGNQEFWRYTHWSWSFKGSSCVEGMFSFLLLGFVLHQVRVLLKLRVWFMMYLVQNYECGIICRALYSHVKTLCMFIFLHWDSYG